MLVFAEGIFQSETVTQSYIVTATTKSGPSKLDKLIDIPVNSPASLATGFVHPALGLIFQACVEFPVARGTVNRFVNVTLDDCETSTDFSVIFVYPVAYDTRHTLPRRWVAIDIGHEQRFTQVHAHGRVTPDAEIAVGPVGPFEDCSVHGVKHGAHLGVRMGGYRPLAIMARVASGALGCGRVEVIDHDSLVRFIGVHSSLLSGRLRNPGGTDYYEKRRQKRPC
jgi:hypothetical protein